MKFSVIIPVYNGWEYLRAGVDSVLEQTGADFEILLVNDGSTDGESGALCDTLAREHPDCIRVLHKPNGGAGDARNAALPLAQGDYVLFLDSDDSYTPEAFAVLAAALEALAPDVCYFGLRMTGDNDGAVFTDDLPLHTPLTLSTTPALLLNRPSACIAAWRRTLFTDTDIRFRARGWGEDLCMTRKMLTAARSVVILPDVLYLYRQHEGSVTKRALDANAEIMDAIDDVLTWYQARGLFEQYENELGKLCVDNVLYDASVRILKAQSTHPLLPQLLDCLAPAGDTALLLADRADSRTLCAARVLAERFRHLRLSVGPGQEALERQLLRQLGLTTGGGAAAVTVTFGPQAREGCAVYLTPDCARRQRVDYIWRDGESPAPEEPLLAALHRAGRMPDVGVKSAETLDIGP